MKECLHKEGYLLIYSEGGDEIHADLISEDHYKRIVANFDIAKEEIADKVDEVAFGTDPLFFWFSQTICNEPWPYSNTKILGTVHAWCL